MKAGLHGILLQPLLTEKITAMREANNTVAFLVHPDANRVQIKQAVETLLKVKVERVNVMNVLGKVKRLGRFSGKRSDWKKALVKLKAGEKLELYESA
ncbi:MAG: 50S ribosomal protein L23 [Nitrospira sp.]|nr:50S ribosomal protein L23 [Nitrospira sp.]